MNVYFGCSMQDVAKFQDTYRAIRDAIIESGHHLTRDWLEESIEKSLIAGDTEQKSDYYEEVMKAILHADLVIFDGTVPSMGTGHQITFAIDKSKPTLMLVDGRVREVGQMFIAGASNPYFTHKNYKDTDDVVRLTKEFLRDNSPQSRVRFHLVLDRAQYNYVEWASFMYKVSKTDVIKGALAYRMNIDEKYRSQTE